MRLVLSCALRHGGGHRFSNDSRPATIDIDALGKLIDDLSWGIRVRSGGDANSDIVNEVLEGLPEGIARRVQGADFVAMEAHIGVMGIASLERSGRITFRAISEDSAELETVAQALVERLPGAAARLDPAVTVVFDEQPEIRDRETQNTIAIADLDEKRTDGFFEFIRTERKRERRVMQVLTALAIACFVAGMVITTRGLPTADHDGHWNPWATTSGYLERGATTFFIAMLTLLINSIVDHRDWLNPDPRLSWRLQTRMVRPLVEASPGPA